MLSSEEEREVQSEIDRYENKTAASIEALRIVQRHHGWISDEALRALALKLEMTPAELDSVATFYNLIFRKPVGEHVVFFCDSISCWILGQDEVRRRITEYIGAGSGETSADGRFTLLPIQCLGTCDHAPAMMVDDELHRDLDPEKVEAVLARYR